MFRNEAIESKPSKIEGNVQIATPVSWIAISFLLAISLITTIAYLASSPYARVETAYGKVSPDKGVAAVRPSRFGTVVEIAVADGERVEADDILATVRTEEDSGQDLSASEQVERAIAQQDASLASQIDAAKAAATAQQGQLTAQQAGLRAEIAQIESQITLQRNLIDTAQADLDQARRVAERGFISQRDLQVREDTLLARQQGLSQINQSMSAKRAALVESERSSAQLVAQARAQSSSLAAARAQVGQQAASTAGSRSYAIRAPIAGTVTALLARTGQPADPQMPLMTIVPAGAELQAELSVPSSAIGFVKQGQEVSLAIDAFPYQRFGTLKGEVLSVAKSALSQRTANGTVLSVYPVRVKLYTDNVTAFGRSEPLMSGMTLSARIVTEKRSLLEWLFEPLFAVGRR